MKDVEDASGLLSFYEQAYSSPRVAAARYGQWRALGAIGKADHVIALCERAGARPARTLEVGCGDGSLLDELARRDFGGRLEGVEISSAAVEIAAARAGVDAVRLYDGTHLPAADGAYELGILSHVLEHVPEPAIVLAETARACSRVVFEVPLEANVSARRSSKRELSGEVGHLHRLDRSSARAIVANAGLQIEAELADALPLSAQLFWAETPAARTRATVKWALRASLHRAAPALARRLFTVHYACLCSAA
jgi:SAM-dependent methyltransferase